MSVLKKIKKRALRRSIRTRQNIRVSYKNNKIRISVFRSLNHLYAQAIDDISNFTVASVSSLKIEKSVYGDKKAVAFALGKDLACKLQTKNISDIVFDRGSYLYHGRVERFADGLREGGLKF